MNTKDKVRCIREKINTGYRRIKAIFEGSERGFYIASQIFLCIFAGEAVSALTRISWAGFLLGAVLVTPIAYFGSRCLEMLLRPLLKCSGRSLTYALLDLGLLLYSAIAGSPGEDAASAAAVAVGMFLAAVFFSKSIWAVFVKRAHSVLLIMLMAVCGATAVAAIVFLAGDGFFDYYVEDYLKWHPQTERQDGFENYGELGEYTVKSLEYSPYKAVELKTETVDLSPYVMEEEGWHRWYRSIFQSYDLTAAPVAGKVWYPSELQNCPVIFMAHGNHSITEESYLGYAYLGEYFASHGYVFVSVDENALNERSGENDGRAVLLLENIKALCGFNKEKDNPLYQKIDEENIALAGHSRGGEMIADAYLFNDCETYPSNGMVEFDYHFSIQALLAVAPTVGQYLPADHEVELSDVNYLVLQGANDQDIYVFMGNEQYENISFTGTENYLKSSLYIAGANHGQFNTLWGKYDMEPPLSWWLNVKNFISAKEQRYILKVFARAFFDAALKGETAYADLLTNVNAYEGYLPDTLYIQQYKQSEFLGIADFEEDTDLTMATDGSELDAGHMSMWTEEKIEYSNASMGDRENYGLRLKWKETEEAFYQITPQSPVSFADASFQFDACNLIEELGENGEGILDFTVVLEDENGSRVSGKVGEHAILYPAFPVSLWKVQHLLGEKEEKYQFQTVTMPIESFTGETKTFDAERVRSITLLFDQRNCGEVWLDNIGIVRNK